MHPVQIAFVVIAAILSSCGLCATFDPAAAAPVAVLSEASPPAVQQTASAGRAYLFRGAIGLIFSRGMDRLTKLIEQAGVTASVNEFTVCTFVAKDAIQEYRRNPAPIILIGHSMGGYCAIKFAERLQAENIPVSLVVTIDPAHITPGVPLNVERFINIYLAHNVLGGGDVVPAKNYQGHYASFDLSKHDPITHINIDKVDAVHTQLVEKIRQLAVTPAIAAGERVPIRYVVPAGAPIELWDSGMPVFSRAGETLDTLAAYYRVPVWSLTQMNQVPANAPLAADQRIVIPRHLVPIAAVSGQPPPSRQ